MQDMINQMHPHESQSKANQDDLNDRTQESSTRNGIGVYQQPVEDEIEPGHVPMSEILKANHEENMQQQSGFQRPSSRTLKVPKQAVQKKESAHH